MTEIEKVCCFTGNRPEKLHISESEAKSLLFDAIESAIKQGFTTFITGMAEGVDTWSGEIVLSFKEHNPDIKLVCALPYPDFSKKSSHILKKADCVFHIKDKYSPFAFRARNEWMVDHSSLVIALSSGKKGGTENTIQYSEKTGKKIMKLEKKPLFKQLSFKKIYD